MDFGKYRDRLESEYKKLNRNAVIRIKTPTDEEMLHLVLAIETYLIIEDEEMYDNSEEDPDWNQFLR